ncbi:MAG: L-fucose/L-arabinose isomerase family protein [Candidatus Omnitrophica bacterium]|nr:L-fucose/L-arabinose isomerase family protein [Candidatus Omnitrophota bacterium]MCA9436134.1 L-fucose/L-arabinose isomerase family protein [Candidatus Omnitrophota bacterium]MCA9445967.1 L-fucose/L-arabinose isomerase family protein [Candidatus Omnitrophota bacterium]MCB9770463.1 L-fucose/L-arabinose isomerase family protein [Candidatus Omnitrophota bacterium]MCB9784831.1 L-fucose/L-arabinose isomerase family protein [Candidatus Omnitrophota bacterium]
MIHYGKFIENRLSEYAEVHNFGMVDEESKAHQAGEWFNQQNVDILFCHASTYAMSASHLPIAQICKRPVVVLNLQPALQMNYAKTTTGEWLAHCVACCVPEISNAFRRARIPFHVVSGLLGLEKTPEISVANEVTYHHPDAIEAWKEIEEWAKAATVTRTLQYGRMGFLGHTYPGMLDMYSDFTMIEAQTGLHVEILEMCDLMKILPSVTEAEKKEKLKQVEDFFVISEDSPADPLAKKPRPEQLDWSCQVAVAQEKLIREFDLDALTYYYRGSDGNEYERLQEAFILGHSLLTGNGIPCSGEGDMKTAVAMKVCDTLDLGGSYSEIVATDFVDQTILMGHDGPFHIGISDQKPILRGMGLYHGKWGSGVSVEAKVRTGPITNLGITQTEDGKLLAISNQGMATDGEILRIGNTMTPVKFDKKPTHFMNEWFAHGPTHHVAMSVGHNTSQFQKVATLMGWDFASVT